MVTVDTNTVGTSADYATLTLWQTTELADITAAGSNVIAKAAMKDEVHTANFNLIGSWTTDATHYIWIDAENEAARHDGIEGTGASLITAGQIPLRFTTAGADVHVTWVEVSDSAPATGKSGFSVLGADITLSIDKVILHGFDNFDTALGTSSSKDGITINLINSLLYNHDNKCIRSRHTNATWRIYNCTFFDVADSTGNHAFLVENPATADCDLRNNLIHVSGTAGCLEDSGGSPWNGSCDQNILSDATGTSQSLPGDVIEDVTFQAGTGGSGDRVMFENVTGGSEDLHILDDANNKAIDYGNNLTGETFPENINIEIDIDGVTRPAAGSWDAGAHQVTVAGGLPIPVAAASYRRRHEGVA